VRAYGAKPTSTLSLSQSEKRFRFYLDKADHKFRADRLLYKDETAAAFRAAALAGPDCWRSPRPALLSSTKHRATSFSQCAPALRPTPATLRQIHKLRHADKIRTAADILVAAPRDPALSSMATNGGSNAGFSPASSSIKTMRRPRTSFARSIPRCRMK